MSAYPRKILASILLLAFCLPLLGGCGFNKTNEEGQTLWVLTEQSTSDGMNYQAEVIAQRMMEANPGLTVQIEILPNDSQRRELALQEVRARIMAGKGPDVYLLPTGNSLIIDYPYKEIRREKYVQVEPLFLDVPQVMRNGIFADIQPFYQSDRALNTDGLNEKIMSAGVLEGKRYVLPLRYTVPVILTAPEDWPSCGLTADLLNAGVVELASTVLSRQSPAFAAGLRLPNDMSLLPALTDGRAGALALSAQELGNYMRLYQAVEAVARKGRENLILYCQEAHDSLTQNYLNKNGILDPFNTFEQLFSTVDEANDAANYSVYNIYWRTAGLPLYVCPIADALESLLIARQEGTEVELFPLRAMDNAIVADITYYGAVASNCQNLELAYTFLKQFLTEEFQWDISRPRVKKGANYPIGGESEKQMRGQIENSWPVRAEGATPYLWDSLQYQLRGISVSTFNERSKTVSIAYQKIELSDEDLPALSWPIDRVRFPVTLPEEESFEHALSLLNEEDGTPTDVDIDALAQQVYQSLWFHLLEG